MTLNTANSVHFLIVDDLAENLTALDALLRRPGLAILKAQSGQEALELLLQYDVALAIVDVQMPGMSGFELAELMRGTERTRRVPIIFVTAGVADRQRRFRGYEAGAVDFLSKPIEPDILRSKSEVFFDLYRERQEVAAQRDELKAATEKIEALLMETQQKARALKEADQRKDAFLATLAHELRNPLAPIRNAIEVLRLRNPEQSELRDPIDIATRQIRHMARLIDDLLDVARIAKGKVELRIEQCDLVEIVQNTAEDYRPTLEAAGIKLQIASGVDEIFVSGDAVRIAQMVGNLLHNAGKFTPRGGQVTICVSKAGAAEGSISVVDTGSGFDLPDASILFEPFSQATSEGRKGGLGLGLALTKGLAQLHGGSLSGESPGFGNGATFTLRLPIAAQAEQTQTRSKPLPIDSNKSLSILVVEDNVDSARSLEMLLSLMGHSVQIAHEGAAALRAAKELRPHVVISDLGLPGELDGYGLAKVVRSDAQLHGVHLIALSGYGRDEDRQRARDSGFNHHLTKPIDFNLLKGTLANLKSSS